MSGRSEPDIDLKVLAEQLEKIIFGVIPASDRRLHNKKADIDHLVGHFRAGRDVFVTNDREILRNKEMLWDQLGIAVESPEELVSRFETEVPEKPDK